MQHRGYLWASLRSLCSRPLALPSAPVATLHPPSPATAANSGNHNLTHIRLPGENGNADSTCLLRSSAVLGERAGLLTTPAGPRSGTNEPL